MISLPLRLCAVAQCRAVCRPLQQSVRAMTLAATPTGPAYQVLHYNYVPNILERRDPYRPQHLQHAKQFAAEGKLALAGALLEPVDSALFVFHNTSREEIEEFVKNDPYVQNGLVPSWTIRPFMVVVGSAAQ